MPTIDDFNGDWEDIGIAVRPPSYPTGGAFWRPGPSVGDLEAPHFKKVLGIPTGVDWGTIGEIPSYVIYGALGAIALIAIAYYLRR